MQALKTHLMLIIGQATFVSIVSGWVGDGGGQTQDLCLPKH